ncbi:YbaB/EbfC family nucleoid-associated protein [Actinoplanes sp. NPDC051633]|uniref:YbaB/EbfC family nucleoid-associated protein n=1 Tax=Actinoplanes sp. NPDC051633 TaxID=3155670 RepID=UPI00342796A5
MAALIAWTRADPPVGSHAKCQQQALNKQRVVGTLLTVIDESGVAMNNIDAAEEWLDSWVAKANTQAERSVALSRRVAALTGTAESNDGAVRVTVGSAGQVENIELTDRISGRPGRDIAAEIMTVMRSAQTALAKRVTEQVRATVGEDTETGRAVINSFDTRFAATRDREGDR